MSKWEEYNRIMAAIKALEYNISSLNAQLVAQINELTKLKQELDSLMLS